MKRIKPGMLCWIIAPRRGRYSKPVDPTFHICEAREYVGQIEFGGAIRDAWEVLVLSGDINGEMATVETCCLYPIPPDELPPEETADVAPRDSEVAA
jgi:hypothetical protein